MTSGTLTAGAARRSRIVSYSSFAFFLLVANLRPPLTVVGPLLEVIRSSLGLSSTAAGLLPTLPLLIFAAVSPFGRLGELFGIERTLAGCLTLIAAGVALRSEGSIAALFGGTVIFAIGIGIANVLVPSLVKRDFPHHVGSTTTAYVMAMTVTGAAATGLAVPASAYFAGGWRSSLAVWAVFAALALVCWLPETRRSAAPVAERSERQTSAKPIWRSATAWQITIFMGLQFLIYYVTIGWMPLFLADHGHTAAEAGWLLTLYQVMSFVVGLIAPTLMRRWHDQSMLAGVASLITALCMFGLFIAPGLAALWLLVCGGSFGITFILAFALIGMRTSDHRRAASLSTMSQAAAYLIAAAGPVAFGWLRDIAAGWTLPMMSLVAVAIIQAAAGLGAGRQGQL